LNTTLRRKKPNVYGVGPEIVPPVPAYLALFRSGGLTYAAKYGADGAFLGALDSTSLDPTESSARAVGTYDGWVCWRSSPTVLKSWNAVTGDEKTFNVPAGSLASEPIAVAAQLAWAECWDNDHLISGTWKQLVSIRLSGGDISGAGAGVTDFLVFVTGSGSPGLAWAAPRGLAVGLESAFAGFRYIVALATAGGAYWLVEANQSGGGAAANVSGSSDPSAAIYAAPGASDGDTVGVQIASDTPANLLRLRSKDTTNTNNIADRWPNTGDWELDSILNFSVYGADALLYGPVGAERRIVQADRGATGGDPVVIVPELHPTLGAQPDRMYFASPLA